MILNESQWSIFWRNLIVDNNRAQFKTVMDEPQKYAEKEEEKEKKELNGNVDHATNQDEHIKILRLINELTGSFWQIIIDSNLLHRTQHFNEMISLKTQIHENNNGKLSASVCPPAKVCKQFFFISLYFFYRRFAFSQWMKKNIECGQLILDLLRSFISFSFSSLFHLWNQIEKMFAFPVLSFVEMFNVYILQNM